MNNLIKRAEILLSSKHISFARKPHTADWTQVLIDSTSGSDFSFFIESYSDGNANIGTHSTSSAGHRDYFHLPYEPEDFNDMAALEDKALQDLELLVLNPVSVRCKRGLFLIDTEAIVLTGNEKKILYGASGLHWSFPFHKDLGRFETYQAKALVKDG